MRKFVTQLVRRLPKKTADAVSEAAERLEVKQTQVAILLPREPVVALLVVTRILKILKILKILIIHNCNNDTDGDAKVVLPEGRVSVWLVDKAFVPPHGTN